MCIKFQLYSSSSFRDMRGSQIYPRVLRPVTEKFTYLKRVLGPVYMCVKFQRYSSSSFR